MPSANPASDSVSLLQQARLALNARRDAEAENLVRQLLRLDARNADALSLQAYICQQRGELAQAEETIRQAIAINDKNGLYYFTYGAILKEQRKPEEALERLQQALQLSPPGYAAQIHFTIGKCLQEKNDLPAAIRSFTTVLELKPEYAPAFFSRAVSRFELGGQEAAMFADINHAIALDPQNADMLQKIAGIFYYRNDFMNAIQAATQAVKYDPASEYGWVMLAHAYRAIGDTATAEKIFTQLLQQHPSNGAARLNLAYLLPAIYQSNADIDHWRERFSHNMGKLLKENITIPNAEWNVMSIPFYHTYHGRDNMQMMRQLAQCFLKCCPYLAFTAPHCLQPPRNKSRIRVGFVAETFDNMLMTQFYGAIIKALAEDEAFEVIIFANSGSMSEKVRKVAEIAHKYVALPVHLAPAQQAIAQEEIDILIYLEIGLKVMNYLLAFARLAPVQAIMPGHPTTSGIPAMDYFISWKGTEPEGAQAHYSEKLICLEHNPAIVSRRFMPKETRSRRELGLPEEAHLYACPVLLHKLHPEMDNIFAAILKRDPKAHILLFATQHTMLWQAQLQQRFARIGEALAARIHFLPFAQGDQFYHILRAVDCVLDSVHYSFGTTAFILLGDNIPFVTLPGEFLRGRGAYGFYHHMGMPDLIASSPEHYVELALKLTNDKEFYQQMRRKIRALADCLFDDHSIVPEYATCLKQLYNEKAGA